MNIVYLTRRNLLALLSKLDRKKKGDDTFCTIIKEDTVHAKFPCTTPTQITAVEDEDYYTDRTPGFVHPKDVPSERS